MSKEGFDEDLVPVKIPRILYEQIRQTLSQTSFHSVDEYVVYALHLSVGKEVKPLTDADEKKVADRLRALGYL